jgi:hypothetical protein
VTIHPFPEPKPSPPPLSLVTDIKLALLSKLLLSTLLAHPAHAPPGLIRELQAVVTPPGAKT